MSQSHFFTDKKQFSQNQDFLREKTPTALFPSGNNEAKYFILSMVKINIVWSVKPDWSINFQFHSALNCIHMQWLLLINKSWCRCLMPLFPFWHSSPVGWQSCPCGVFWLNHHTTSHCTMKNKACWGTQPVEENRDVRVPDSHDRGYFRKTCLWMGCCLGNCTVKFICNSYVQKK